MATASLNPKSIPPLFTILPSIPSTQKTHLAFAKNPAKQFKKYASVLPNAKKKNPWLDPFDQGDDPEMEYGELFSDGKQEEDPRPPDNPDNPYGFLKFPAGYAVEIASLGLKIRGDVRRCCCVISGGVYENLLFFPAIQLIKDRYPGVQVDVVTSVRGKQTYEINKNVRWANEYDLDDDWPDPAEYIDMIGVIKAVNRVLSKCNSSVIAQAENVTDELITDTNFHKNDQRLILRASINRYYDMILSTKLAGIGHAAFLFMSTARDRVSYVYPNVNAVGAGLMLSETFTPDSMNLSEGGYHMYQEMIDWLGRPARNVPRQPLPPLQVSISRKLKEVVEAKYKNAGVQKGKYIVIHGIQSDSKASMQSRGDTDSLLPLEIWNEITSGIRGLTPVFVIPHEKERENVEEIITYDVSIVFITTPGQLAALINDSAGVIATNTAAIQLASARGKPSVALFGSEDKAKVFVPNAEEKKCAIISSKTGKLVDIDVEAVKTAIRIYTWPLAIA